MLTKEQVLALPEGKSTHWVRLKRLYYPQPVDIYTGKAELIVQYRKKAFRGYPAGVSAIGVNVHGLDWADFCDDDIQPGGPLVAEDYYMEILD